MNTGPRPGSNRVRIIAGHFRRRYLLFPQIEPPIRPTPDRVRETLFNWLQGAIPGTRCLDLFAGSGALGFEALSRGAHEVGFVDSQATITRYLRETLIKFAIQDNSVWTADVFAYLEGDIGRFDLVFLDPPFREQRHALLLDSLLKGGHLNPHALVYLEWHHDRHGAELPLPAGWSFRRQAHYGQVGFGLVEPPALSGGG
ncbi:methyltransferase [mine drainage metagenome]|uniref:Methyltransferase n=1 Tax=mine drainage metagenome TaxID=410659 RepID=T0ZAI2_9ZZZZ